MADIPTFERLLKMLLNLASSRNFTKNELCDRYRISQRTFYRDIKTLQNVGFAVEQQDGLYWIDKTASLFKELHELPYFSEEEAFIMQHAIHSINENNQLKTKLVQKLYSLYKFGKVAEVIVKKEQSENIHNLMEAIRQKKRVILHDYHSANSNTIQSRTVEPFDFTTNYIATWAFDCNDKVCKTFKNSRIGKVEVLDATFRHEDKHNSIPMDVFRISAQNQTTVKIKLSLRAAELLREEYPLSEKYISDLGNGIYHFEAPVSSFEGVGRFILGLCEEIQILYPEALKSFIKNKAKKMVGWREVAVSCYFFAENKNLNKMKRFNFDHFNTEGFRRYERALVLIILIIGAQLKMKHKSKNRYHDNTVAMNCMPDPKSPT